jgi:hypothetical protein
MADLKCLCDHLRMSKDTVQSDEAQFANPTLFAFENTDG